MPILSFNSSNVWGVCNFYLWGHLKNKVYATNPYTLEEMKASIRHEIDYFGNWINLCKCTFPKQMPEMCGWRRTTFPTSHVIRYVIIFLCNFTQLWAVVQQGYCFRFAGRDLRYQRLPSPAAVLRATLKRKALYYIICDINS